MSSNVSPLFDKHTATEGSVVVYVRLSKSSVNSVEEGERKFIHHSV